MKKTRFLLVPLIGLFILINIVCNVVFAQVQRVKKPSAAPASSSSTSSSATVSVTETPVQLDDIEFKKPAAAVVQNKTAVYSVAQKRIIETAFVCIVGYILLFSVIGIINRRVKNIRTRHILRKNIFYLFSFGLIILVFFIWVQNLNSISIFLGVAGAGLALALQEVILSVAGWLLILIRHPFVVGDRIEINGFKGDIIDIRVFQTSLLEIGNWVNADQSTGRIVNFPNSFVFKHANYNYSRGFEFIWNEMPVLLTFESAWRRGREIMLAHANTLAEGMEDRVRRKIDAMLNRYLIYYGKLTPIVYVNIKDSGVELTLRYLTEAKKRRSTQDQLCRDILDEFEKEPNVNFAYPTYRIVQT